MYKINSRVRYSEIGLDKCLTLGSLINYFQDCSTFASEDAGAGLSIIEKEQRAWILNAWQIIINRFPDFSEDITVGTFAHGFNGLYGYRNFLMYGEDNLVCAYANSIWVYMDTKTFRPVRIPESAMIYYQLEESYPMPYASRKISFPNTFVMGTPFSINASHIDTNHHVNNSQYVKMAQEFIPPDFRIGQMRAEYRASAYVNDSILPKMALSDSVCTIDLCNPSDVVYARVEFTRKDD